MQHTDDIWGLEKTNILASSLVVLLHAFLVLWIINFALHLLSIHFGQELNLGAS